MCRPGRAPRGKHMGASRNRLSPAAFSPRVVVSAVDMELRYMFGSTIQIGCTAARLHSCPVSQCPSCYWPSLCIMICEKCRFSKVSSAQCPVPSAHTREGETTVLGTAYCVFWRLRVWRGTFEATGTPGNRNNYPSCPRSTTMIPGGFDIQSTVDHARANVRLGEAAGEEPWKPVT